MAVTGSEVQTPYCISNSRELISKIQKFFVENRDRDCCFLNSTNDSKLIEELNAEHGHKNILVNCEMSDLRSNVPILREDIENIGIEIEEQVENLLKLLEEENIYLLKP